MHPTPLLVAPLRLSSAAAMMVSMCPLDDPVYEWSAESDPLTNRVTIICEARQR